jgi:hypothetical protein
MSNFACGECFDMRDLDQAAKHVHDGEFEIGEVTPVK